MRRLRDLLAPEAAALDLAVLRVTIAIVIAGSTSVAVATEWAALPPAARVAPLGVGWLVPWLPIDPTLVGIARVVLWVACAFGALGLFSRASFAVISIAAFYVLMIPQLGGAVFHDHHLLWLAVVLAASPCGDALSLDAMIARRRGHPLPARGRAYGAALRLAWILIGLVFFFPGLHKLTASGLAWITSDNLRNQLWWKWAQDPSLEPALRIDRHPWLLHALAALTIVFELTFLPLVFWRRTRALAVIGALLFHQATDYFMGVRFTVLYACYTMFVPWDAIVRRFWPRAVVASSLARSTWPTAIAGAMLVLGVSAFGAMRQMQAYPFACYPTFHTMPGDRMPGMEVEIERADGSRATIDRDLWRERGPRGWALEWRLAGVYDGVHRERIEAWWHGEVSREPLRSSLRGARIVRFYRVEIAVDPDRRGEVLSRREILRLEG